MAGNDDQQLRTLMRIAGELRDAASGGSADAPDVHCLTLLRVADDMGRRLERYCRSEIARHDMLRSLGLEIDRPGIVYVPEEDGERISAGDSGEIGP